MKEKIDLLIGVVEDISEQVKGHAGIKPSVHRWVSSAELGVLFGYTQKHILNLTHENKFPEGLVKKRKRGKYNIHRFDAEKILPYADKYLAKSTG